MENFERPEDEINFSNLLKNPIRLFGLIYPLSFVLLIVIGMYWVYNMDYAYLNRIPAVKLARDTVATEIPMQKGSIQPGVDIKTISNPTLELISKGKEIYAANCASCHGAEGRGDGIAGANLNPKPRNFYEKDGWKNGRKLSEMYKTLEEGIAGGGMVSYNFLPITDRVALIHYIHSLMGDYPKDSEEDLANLEQTYKLSEGKNTPNQIPVDKALQLLIKENNPKNQQIDFLIKQTEKDPEAELFNSVITNKKLAISTLINDNEWKKSPVDFYNKISKTININGFNSKFLRLEQSEINKLFSYLQRLIIYNS